MYVQVYVLSGIKTTLTMPNITHDVGFITWIINKNLTSFKDHFVIFSTAPVATIIIFLYNYGDK